MTLSGRRESVAGSARDFRQPRWLGPVLPRLFEAHGDFYLLRAPRAAAPSGPGFAARGPPGFGPGAGRVHQQSLPPVLYGLRAGRYTKREIRLVYGQHAGLCLECQGHPDGTNKPEFSDILVRPDFPQRRLTRYAFSTF